MISPNTENPTLIFLKQLFHRLLPKHALTRFAGLLANVTVPWIKNYLIKNFIKDYKVDMTEALESDPKHYASFNDFFIRRLKPGARVLEKAELISPVDGYVSAFGDINQGQLLQAKGVEYTVEGLLASKETQAFHQGSFATLYLSPKDYHRVHMPLAGTLKKLTFVPGKLHSVQPFTTKHIPDLFAKNERLIFEFETSHGPMVVVMVGAVVVGKIGTVWQGDLPRLRCIKHFDISDFSNTEVKQGDELGYFKLGSTAIVLFPKQVQWSKNITTEAPIQLGHALGHF